MGDQAELQAHRLAIENKSLRRLAANAMTLARNGDYANGVTDPMGSIDEGTVRAGQAFSNLEAAAKALDVVIGCTFYDNDQRYGT